MFQERRHDGHQLVVNAEVLRQAGTTLCEHLFAWC